MAFKNVAIAGANGTAGSKILKALVDSNKFNVTILARSGSSKESNGNVKTVTVDFSDASALAAALNGIDAVVCALPHTAEAQQKALVDASVAAGVQRFLPSEFGSDTLNPQSSKLPIFAGKIAIQKKLAALASENKISYTLVVTGPFIDFILANGFLGLDFKSQTATNVDGGSVPFSCSTLATVGAAVVGVLTHPDETKNRPVYVQSVCLSNRDYVEIAKQYTPLKEWAEVDGGRTADIEAKSYADLAAGKKDMSVMFGFLYSAVYRDGYGGQFGKLDNDLLGIKQMSREEVGEFINGITAQ